MGLDVRAYTNLKEEPNIKGDEDNEFDDPHLIVFYEDGYPEQYAGLKAGMTYRFESMIRGPSFSYSGYSFWREQLAELTGNSLNFIEQINFTDCEGTLGPVVCAKLANDYIAFDELAKKDAWFYEAYTKFKNIFILAANNGAVVYG